MVIQYRTVKERYIEAPRIALSATVHSNTALRRRSRARGRGDEDGMVVQPVPDEGLVPSGELEISAYAPP